MDSNAGKARRTPPLGTSRQDVNSGYSESDLNILAAIRPRVFVAPMPIGAAASKAFLLLLLCGDDISSETVKTFFYMLMQFASFYGFT